jgi:hypothetical protein
MPRSIIELRQYKMRSGTQIQRTANFLQQSFVPAAARAGIAPLGFFNALVAPDGPFVLCLSAYPSLAAYESAHEKLAADREYQKAADGYNSAADLNYIRIDSSLLLAFPSMPSVAPPPAAENQPPRIFELRTYESPNEKTLERKIKMFGDGEIDFFRKAGMLTVFFGQTIVGPGMPNLVYMLAYDDLAARDRTWKAFSADPGWQKLRAMPGLSDTEIVSNISNSILRPLPFSQIR